MYPMAVPTHSAFLIILYTIQFLVAAATFISLTKHVNQRAKIGAVSGFMASLWLFMLFFAFQMLMSVVLRIRYIYEIQDEEIVFTVMNFWTASHFGTATFLIFIGLFVIKKRFDLYIVTKSEKEVNDANKTKE